jgi:type I restriction enzyme S subunit
MIAAWSPEPLGELCELVNGRAFKPEEWGKTGLPIVRIQNLNDPTKPFNYFAGQYSQKHLVNTGDVLLSWSGTPGTSFGCFIWTRGEALLNQHIFRVAVRPDKISSEFFVHSVNNVLRTMIDLAHGAAGLRHITKAKLEKIQLLVPPLEEQLRITTRIKECMERVNEIEKLKLTSFSQAEAVLPSVLHDAFESFSASTPVLQIGQLATETRYGTSLKCHPGSEGTPILRIPNVAAGEVNFDDLKYCDLPSDDLERIRLRNGDLLFVRTNGSRNLVGRSAVFETNEPSQSFGFASYLIRVRLDSTIIHPKFLSYFLNSTDGREELNKRRRTSAGQFNINSENLRTIPVPTPPLPDQVRLLRLLADREMRALQLVARMRDAKQECAFLRGSILRRAFSGEL